MLNENLFTEARIAQLQAFILRGEELIAEQRRRIERIEAEGGEATAARETLLLMHTMQAEMIEHRDLAMKRSGARKSSA